MKTLLAISTILFFTACGSENDSGEANACTGSLINGTWESVLTGERLGFGSDCSVTSDLCGTQGTIENITLSGGTAFLEIDSYNGLAGCLGAGLHSCAYLIEDDLMGINCAPGREALYDQYYERL